MHRIGTYHGGLVLNYKSSLNDSKTIIYTICDISAIPDNICIVNRTIQKTSLTVPIPNCKKVMYFF